ncbi:hypothetical protein GTY54_19935 [Streptomyces sp. SID625]|nr:hypothetical protein [Streptomyces sp. SID625]
MASLIPERISQVSASQAVRNPAIIAQAQAPHGGDGEVLEPDPEGRAETQRGHRPDRLHHTHVPAVAAAADVEEDQPAPTEATAGEPSHTCPAPSRSRT